MPSAEHLLLRWSMSSNIWVVEWLKNLLDSCDVKINKDFLNYQQLEFRKSLYLSEYLELCGEISQAFKAVQPGTFWRVEEAWNETLGRENIAKLLLFKDFVVFPKFKFPGTKSCSSENRCKKVKEECLLSNWGPSARSTPNNNEDRLDFRNCW